MKYTEVKERLFDQAEICRATLPMLAAKPEVEKSLDDRGLEHLMSGFMFLYDDYPNPSIEQFEQLKQTAATCAETYHVLMSKTPDETEPDEESILNLAYGFLMLYRFKVNNNKEKMN